MVGWTRSVIPCSTGSTGEQVHASQSAPLASMPLPSIALCFAGAARYDAAGRAPAVSYSLGTACPSLRVKTRNKDSLMIPVMTSRSQNLKQGTTFDPPDDSCRDCAGDTAVSTKRQGHA